MATGILTVMLTTTLMGMPRFTPPPMRRRLTTATDATATETMGTDTMAIETSAMAFVTRATAMAFATPMAFATRATAMVFATRATAPVMSDDRSGLADTVADLPGRDMDALGKPPHRAAEHAGARGN
jgi:hypothetical protein